jgi:hypothetical protein
MPYKHNADRRHHIPKMAFKVQNWPEYEAGLRRRGSLTLWIDAAALDHWQTFGPGGQARYKDVAIQTTLMVRTAFRLALRQTEGLMASVITLMDLTISAPDHSTISRRAVTLPVIQAASVPHGPLHLLIDSTGLQVYGAGQWLEAKHGAKSRRKWRKGVVQNLPILGYRARGNHRPAGAGFRLEDCPVREAASLPGSGSLGLKRSQAQQSEPMRMALSRHQFARAFAVTLGAPTAHEAPVVQEELQQA